MGIFDRFRKRNNGSVALVNRSDWDAILCRGYTSLADNAEITAGVGKIATLTSTMTLHLMNNTSKGDERIVNELSRKLDINPNNRMTRKTFIEAIVQNLLLYGNGNSIVIPRTKNGLLDNLEIVPPARTIFVAKGSNDYTVRVDGVNYSPDDIIHFVFNPDENYPWRGKGVTTTLSAIANNIKQGRETEKSFMGSKWKPSVIIKVDALADEFASKEGRDKLLESYFETEQAGQPWLIPAEQFSVEQVRPLSLADLAITDTMTINKETIASILGVPPFVLGVGRYDKESWNNFIYSTIQPLAKGIAMELTRKLVLNPKWYLRFNVASLLDYDLRTISDVYGGLSDRGFVTGNEVRDRMGMSPLDGLDELRILENYIPFDLSGNQKKLIQED